MSSAMDRGELLALAKRSPALVGAHDYAGWRALFAEGGRVEDPVGTPACEKGATEPDGLQRFWRTFIAPNRIWFDEHLDFVGERAVARDVLIHMEMSSGLVSAVPAYLLYDFSPTAEGPRVTRLAAHWEAARASKAMLAKGGLGVRTVFGSSVRIFRHLGLAGGRAYMNGTQGGVRARGKASVASLAEALSQGALDRALAFGGSFELDDAPISAAALAARLGERGLGIEEPRASGDVVAARLQGLGDGPGLGFFQLSPDGERLVRARLYTSRV